jgi:DNA-binding MarR family transcriptional regulator
LNKTVDLITKWAKFSEKHPDASIDDFCRHHLITKRENKNINKLFSGEQLPPHNNIILTKLINRISKLNLLYFNLIVPETGIEHIDEFQFLVAIANMKNPMKTEVINHNFTELSTGLLVIERLKKKKYITEHSNPDDKRSKRLKITEKGQEVLNGCFARLRKIHEMMYYDLSEEDIKLCIQLLQGIEIKFSTLWHTHKGKAFNEIHKEVVGNSKKK